MTDIVATLRLTGPPGEDPAEYPRIVGDFQRMVDTMSRKYVRDGGALTITWHMEGAEMAETFTVTFELSVVGDVVTLLFDGSPAGLESQTMPEENDGTVIFTITATTTSGDPYLTPIIFTGDESGSFTLTNGGVCPCQLVTVGDLALGEHTGEWSFEAP